MVAEEWRPISGFEGIYDISNLGRIRSLDRLIKFSDGRNRFFPGIEVKRRSLTSSGYLQVLLHMSGQKHPHYVHRLVAEAFVENPHCKATVNHKDEDKLNNIADNLEWATQGENNAYNNGYTRRCANRDNSIYREQARRNSLALRKPVVQLDCEQNPIRFWNGIGEAARGTETNRCGIWDCLNGRSKTAGGFKWQYA